MKYIIAALFAFSFNSANASVIDFNTLSMPRNGTNGIVVIGGTYSEDGYTMNASSGRFAYVNCNPCGFIYGGTTALFENSYPNTTVLAKDDGGLFDMLSIDIAILTPGAGGPGGLTNNDMTLNGTKFDGSIISQTFTGFGGFNSYFLNNFTNLQSVSWSHPGNPYFFQYDNIVLQNSAVSSVPVPAAAWLFGSGLLGFAGFRRKANA
jgi:hypothetical protein